MNFSSDILTQNEKAMLCLRALYLENGFSRYSMSKFEEYDLYSKNKDFLVSDRVITFTDTNGRLMALKPDVTLSIIKNIPDCPDGLKKLCYDENIYRVSPGSGSFKELLQSGLECVGSVDEKCISEVLLLAAKSLSLFGRDFVLVISNLDILTAFAYGITDDQALREKLIAYAGEKNLHSIAEACAQAGIDREKTEGFLKLLGLYGSPAKVISELKKLCGSFYLSSELNALCMAAEAFEKNGLADRIKIDFSLTADLNYYNGISFKGYINGVSGSVLSGGQYDALMRCMGKKSKAIGFAVYLDMLDRLEVSAGGIK